MARKRLSRFIVADECLNFTPSLRGGRSGRRGNLPAALTAPLRGGLYDFKPTRQMNWSEKATPSSHYRRNCEPTNLKNSGSKSRIRKGRRPRSRLKGRCSVHSRPTNHWRWNAKSNGCWKRWPMPRSASHHSHRHGNPCNVTSGDIRWNKG